MSFPHPAVTEMLRVWTQNRTNFAQICLVKYPKRCSREGNSEQDRLDGQGCPTLPPESALINEVARKTKNDISVHLNELEFSNSWTPSRCQRKIRFGQGRFIAGQSTRNAAIHDHRNFHSGQIFLLLIRRLYSTAPISTFSRHAARGPTMGNWHWDIDYNNANVSKRYINSLHGWMVGVCTTRNSLSQSRPLQRFTNVTKNYAEYYHCWFWQEAGIDDVPLRASHSKD